MVDVLKIRTLKFFFSLFVISEKVLVFESLECGLYHEQKRIICMLKCDRNVLKTRRYDSVLSTHFVFL